ncbi:cell wall hydrolase [Sphingomonas sp.]|jgi:spore germination cell wall hydrolase CwlJ-like protein|uniref:cell wall hydrolase n=1 Tax=Sphingomonas sp. TaxID=28214 RepID=UPI002D7EE2F0|nr:cell wall hydrolase [Sphingomonas sp.]HEU0045500.1 cell wall hydrolase [Sphingomonas sp.]
MSFFTSTARVAAIMLTTAGIFGASSAGRASDYDRATVPVTAPATVTPVINPSSTPLVPQPLASAAIEPPVASTPRTAFASLAHAVAAQTGTIEDEHVRCLASAVYFESKGEPLVGQLAVAQVIINRSKSGRFASNVCGVVKQRGQFSFVRGGAIPAVDGTRAAYRTAVAVAKVAMSDIWQAEAAADALYFNGVRAGLRGLKRVATIGGHAFYR